MGSSVAERRSRLVALAGRLCAELQQDRWPRATRALAEGLLADEDLFSSRANLGDMYLHTYYFESILPP